MQDTKQKELIAFVLPSRLPGMGGWGNGYVAIPKGHPCYGTDYDTINRKYNINVHGSITYSGDADSFYPSEVQGMWIVGFDTRQGGDNKINWPDESSVMQETILLKGQLEAIGKEVGRE